VKESISRRQALGLAGAGTSVVAFGMMGGEANADEGRAQDGPGAMGSIGVTRAQVARLSVVNYDRPALAAGGIAGGGCLVALEIRRLSGAVLASRRVQVAPGTGAYLDVANVAGQAAREQIYGVVTHILQGSRPPRPDHAMGATLEVFDAGTGTTVALLLPAVQKIREAANRAG